ncbi:hypothetical protein A3F66_03080 [candidate division TM6 bacterium RIFCSPHIGHO2_12_FULL_32_22]|nr:MAG: hypothetical protein A3F66_03080 [candidate division TM6 bacterium RIFCSPHIGHO2_12_FULL_32_22]
MKKLILFLGLFLGTLKAAQMDIIDAAEDNWSIGYEDLERAYKQSEVKIRGVPNLVDLATGIIAKNICDPAIKNLPWELQDIIAQQWYKEKFGKCYDHALKRAQTIPFITTYNRAEYLYRTRIPTLKNGDIATRSFDGRTLVIRNSITGEEKRRLTGGHDKKITSIAILPNGDIVTGSYDKTARIWDTITGIEKRKLTGHTHEIFSIAILPNGDIVTGSRDRTAIIWDTITGKQKVKLVGHNSSIESIVILPNGDIVTGSSDGRATLWKISESIKKLFGSDLNNITLDILCELDRLCEFENKFKPKKSNPSCTLCTLL